SLCFINEKLSIGVLSSYRVLLSSSFGKESILWTYVLFCSLDNYNRLVLDFVPFNTHHRSITLLAMVENEFGLCEKDIYRIFEVE
uniref:hypothetical protein n=1 Tax=Segatella copri TaxID=165179 RepID=UPI0040292E7D